MITFDKLWQTMKEKGVSTYKLREECGIDSKTVRRLKPMKILRLKRLISFVPPLIVKSRI